VFPTGDTLLLPQVQFVREEVDGKRTPKPGAAKLLMLTPKDGAFVANLLEDPDSRVFHKALCVTTAVGPRLLTIGATEARLKLWRVENGQWQAETLWGPSFGGKWDRLRDIEIANLDADPEPELAIATHDQGVIALGDRRGGAWHFTEIDRAADTFVHEVEVGDVDGDGKPEIFATPSKPNKADHTQGGGILAFIRRGERWQRVEVARFERTHAKEILVADLDGNGKPELYAALEAVRNRAGAESPVEIRRYLPKKTGPWPSQLVAEIPGGVQARVLLQADLTGAGKPELVVTTMKGGIWRLLRGKPGKPWQKLLVTKDSSGFEHAAGVADLDGDGRQELYVSADVQDEIRRYVWDGKAFSATVLAPMERSDLTWDIHRCQAVDL